MAKEEKAKKDKSASKKADKENKLDKFDARGVQTLFRTLSRNHYNLIRMIDNKASIILTVNSIIISLLLGVIFVAPQEQKHVLQLSAKVLLNCGMASMVFALLAMLPHKYLSLFKKDTAYKGSLYAGSFSKMSFEEYRMEMKRIMSSGNNLYDEMTRDLYHLGKSIRRKQTLIVISFILFLVGLTFSSLHTLSHGVILEEMFFK